MRRNSEECLSDLALDRCLAGELAPSERQSIESHVNACDACRARQAELGESRRRFAREAPGFGALARAALEQKNPSSAQELGALAPRRRERRRWVAAAAALAAAGVALVVGSPRLFAPATDGAPGAATRTKGGVATLGWVVRRGERVLRGAAEDPLRAGDALRFTVSTREPVYVAVLGLDASGRVSVYHPDTERLARVEVGQDQPLPAAIVFDAPPSHERLYGVFCFSAVPVSSVKQAVEAAPGAPALPDGCTHESWALGEAEQ
jgi:hypothetical protein